MHHCQFVAPNHVNLSRLKFHVIIVKELVLSHGFHDIILRESLLMDIYSHGPTFQKALSDGKKRYNGFLPV